MVDAPPDKVVIGRIVRDYKSTAVAGTGTDEVVEVPVHVWLDKM
jgi:hypothetical protein